MHFCILTLLNFAHYYRSVHRRYQDYDMSTLVASNKAASVRASELLHSELKRFSVELPASVHQALKMIAAAHGTTTRALLLEACVDYIIPKYTVKE